MQCTWSAQNSSYLRTTAKVLTTTYLDSVLKAETSLCQENIVKAIVFPVVMYRCESWTIKKAEHWRIDAGIVVLEKTLESPLDSKEIRPVNPKRNQTWLFTGRADAEAKAPILWPPDMKSKLSGKDPDTGYKIEGRRRSGWQRMKWLDGIIDSMDMNLSKLQEIVKDREAWHAAEHGVTKSQTWLSSWTIWQKWY